MDNERHALDNEKPKIVEQDNLSNFAGWPPADLGDDNSVEHVGIPSDD